MLRKISSLTIFRASCDFLQFFVMLIITEVQSELWIQQNLQKLRKILTLTIFCVTCDFWQFFVMLKDSIPLLRMHQTLIFGQDVAKSKDERRVREP